MTDDPNKEWRDVQKELNDNGYEDAAATVHTALNMAEKTRVLPLIGKAVEADKSLAGLSPSEKYALALKILVELAAKEVHNNS